MSSASLAVLAAPALALVGGLAAACFAKVVGTVFLGTARTPDAERGHEPPPAMLAPMAVLAAACAVIGLLPAPWIPALARAAAGWSGLPVEALAGPAADAAASGWKVSLVALVLLALAGALAAWRRARLGDGQPAAPTWGCGYAAPTPRMQYTGSSFAELLVLRFRWVFFPRKQVHPPAGPFPRHAAFDSHMPDTVLDVAIAPALRHGVAIADRVRARVGSRVQSKVLMLLFGVVGLLLWLLER